MYLYRLRDLRRMVLFSILLSCIERPSHGMYSVLDSVCCFRCCRYGYAPAQRMAQSNALPGTDARVPLAAKDAAKIARSCFCKASIPHFEINLFSEMPKDPNELLSVRRIRVSCISATDWILCRYELVRGWKLNNDKNIPKPCYCTFAKSVVTDWSIWLRLNSKGTCNYFFAGGWLKRS